MVKVTPLAATQLTPCATLGRAWRLWAARYSQSEVQPPGAQPPPQGLKRAASKVADFTACVCVCPPRPGPPAAARLGVRALDVLQQLLLPSRCLPPWRVRLQAPPPRRELRLPSGYPSPSRWAWPPPAAAAEADAEADADADADATHTHRGPAGRGGHAPGPAWRRRPPHLRLRSAAHRHRPPLLGERLGPAAAILDGAA